MVDKFFLYMGIATVVLIITFIIFVVLYTQDKDKFPGINEQVLSCNTKLDDANKVLASSDTSLRNCQRAQEQLTATLEVNFEVDTSGFTDPNFIRDHTTDKNGDPLDSCNYPILTPRFVYNHDNYQTCNFAFEAKNFPRCSTRNTNNNGYGKCSTKFDDKHAKFMTVGSDAFLFGGYTDDVSPCHYWKLVNLLNPTTYQFDVALSYFTDTSVEETIYISKSGDPTTIDSSITVAQGKGDSCMPSNMIGKITINGVKGTPMEGQSDIVTFPVPSQDFVISLWYNSDIKSPSATFGYVITQN